jgi:RNA polymerase sigma-70 factor (ECF subfamily)
MSPTSDFHSQIEGQRAYLLRYATLQLRNAEAAEDAVQETLLAALAGEAGFSGRSSLRTWLTGILKHKIVDAIRRTSREQPLGAEDAETGLAGLDALFVEDGHWRDPPATWDDPDRALEQKQFFAALEMCLERLPARTARAFLMREHLGLETEEICKELAITSTNCWVMLYRARMTLRQCLEVTWFGEQEARR